MGGSEDKGLSITKALIHALKNTYRKDRSIEQKNTETSLIEQFTYPKYGPGQMWGKVATMIEEMGGEIIRNTEVVGINSSDQVIRSVKTKQADGGEKTIAGDYFFSTMPVKDLINAMSQKVPGNVKEVANGLVYRDFITVGLLLKKMKIENNTKLKTTNNIMPDNWIYIQERDVKIGRLQIFNNWSPYMVKNKNNVWLGLEYFCNEGDELWKMPDEELIHFAIKELEQIDLIDSDHLIDSTIIRMPKTYPAYFGTYDRFEQIREFTDRIKNLFLIGRNGMHKYNNADHSMLTAMTAVENIINRKESKENIWAVNTEGEYHEQK